MPNFRSDNVTGAHPAILASLTEAAEGDAMPYGADDVTRGVEARLAEIFERDLAAFPVATGTAANSLALAVATPPYGAIYCHEDAHINVDECGAPEFFAGGAKLVGLPGRHGKLASATLSEAIEGAGVVHHVQPAAVSLTQASEAGTVYTPDEIAGIAEVARHHRIKVHMDGARFANALVHLGCSPAEATWKAGVDALSFGATKNGAMAAEAVIFFDREAAGDFVYRRKRGGHLFSKMRFLSAQLRAYLEEDLWLANARHANAMATRLGEGLAALPDAALIHPVEANEVFVRLPQRVVAGLEMRRVGFYLWGPPADCVLRFVTSFATAAEEVEEVLTAARSAASALGAAPV